MVKGRRRDRRGEAGWALGWALGWGLRSLGRSVRGSGWGLCIAVYGLRERAEGTRLLYGLDHLPLVVVLFILHSLSSIILF